MASYLLATILLSILSASYGFSHLLIDVSGTSTHYLSKLSRGSCSVQSSGLYLQRNALNLQMAETVVRPHKRDGLGTKAKKFLIALATFVSTCHIAPKMGNAANIAQQAQQQQVSKSAESDITVSIHFCLSQSKQIPKLKFFSAAHAPGEVHSRGLPRCCGRPSLCSMQGAYFSGAARLPRTNLLAARLSGVSSECNTCSEHHSHPLAPAPRRPRATGLCFATEEPRHRGSGAPPRSRTLIEG